MKVFIIFIIFIFLGCSHSTQRVDSKALHLTTIHWGSEDLNEMAEEMITSILKNKDLSSSPKKVLSFLKIKNSTYDHIDTQSISEMIKTGLVKSSRFTMIDIKHRDILNRELDYQNIQQKYFQKIKKIGKQLGIDGFFYGEISAIYQKNSTDKDMHFIFRLNLVDIQSAELIWSEKLDIRKRHKKDLIGW